MKKALSVFFNGVINENPTFRMVLGMCPTLALTTAAINGIGMGLATTFVLIGSNLVISLLKNFIPQKIRIPAFVVVIATFVTVVSMIMQAFLPELNESLGIYIPLIVVNCIILARAESFASKNSALLSVVDGLGMGVGFTLALLLLGSIREILGAGTWFGMPVFPESFSPAVIMILPPGGFITLGLVLGLLNKLTGRTE
ncbi:MAG: electron transport complex subunit E [Caldicoprobacter sp.]|uniref:electron transport complex subunit RsxE n=1 Tax=Caldicoprobacter sp. TaxID=2004500 RepID=UPI001D5FD72A|nr:electron transport complex subunit RsxE [Clostridia bacterium]